MPKYSDREAFFEYDLYKEVYFDDCKFIIMSQRSVDLLMSVSRYIKYVNTRWHHTDGSRLTQAEKKEVYEWYEQLQGELLMSCDIAVFERIAVALEKMEAKQPDSITLQEFAEQLATSSWIGTFADAAEVLAFLQTVFPFFGINIKLDATQLVLGIINALIEKLRWQTIFAQWTQSNVYLAAIAAAEAGEDVIGVIDEATDNVWQGIDTIAELLIFGQKYYGDISDFLQDLFGILFGGEEPQPGSEVAARLQEMNTILQGIADMEIVNNITVNACCDGATGTSPGDNQIITEPDPLDDGGSFPPGFNDLQSYLDYKCRAAEQIQKSLADAMIAIGNWPNYIATNVIDTSYEAYQTVENWTYSLLPNHISYNMTPGKISSFREYVAIKLFLAAQGQEIDCVTQTPTGISDVTRLFSTFEDIGESISGDTDMVCELFNSSNVSEASGVIGDVISTWAQYALDNNPYNLECNFTHQELVDFMTLFVTNGFVNILFTDSAYTTVLSADCSGCNPVVPADFNLVYGSLVSQVDDVYTFNPTFISGVGYFVTLHFGQDPGTQQQTGPRGIVEEFIGVIPNIPSAQGAWRGDADQYLGGSGGGWDTYYEATVPNMPLVPLRTFLVFSSSSFTDLQLRITAEQ